MVRAPAPTTTRRARIAGSRVRAALAPLLLAPAIAQAWDVDWALGLGLEYSDNIARVPEGETSDFIVVPRGELAVREHGTRVQFDAVGSAEFRHYVDGTFDDELRAELAARANFVISPERFSWTVEDYLAQEPIDIFAADRPDNTQRVNVFLTGPTARFRLAPATALQAELRYVDTWAEETDAFDGHRHVGALRFMREASEISRYSINAEAQRARFDAPSVAAPDYDRFDTYLRYEREGARLERAGEIGWTWIEYDRSDDISGLRALAEATWALSSVSTLDAALATQYTDSAQDLILQQPATSLGRPLPLTDARRTTVTADVFEERRLELGYARQGDRTYFRVGGFHREQDYETIDALDVRSRGATFDIAYRISARQTISGFAFHERRDYSTVDRDDRDRVLGVRWRLHWLERLWLGAEIAHTARDSSDPLQEFDELRALLTLTLSRDGA